MDKDVCVCVRARLVLILIKRFYLRFVGKYCTVIVVFNGESARVGDISTRWQ